MVRRESWQQDRADHDRRSYYRVNIPTTSSAPSASRRARTARCGSPSTPATRSGGSRPPALSPNIRSLRPAASLWHHGGAGRRAVVHRVRRQQDRADHDGRRDHRVPGPDRAMATQWASPRGRTARCGSPKSYGNKIGRITTGGLITEYTFPRPAADPGASRRGRTARCGSPSINGNKIGRITTAGRHHRIHRPHRQQPPHWHHGGAGRRAVVHRADSATRSGASRPAGVSPNSLSPRQ